MPGATEARTVLRVSEAMVADGLADLRWALHDALLSGARRLVLDVSGVPDLTSSAVASFLAAHRTCRARGGGVVLTGINRRTEEMLHRTGLSRVFLATEAPHERSVGGLGAATAPGRWFSRRGVRAAHG